MYNLLNFLPLLLNDLIHASAESEVIDVIGTIGYGCSFPYNVDSNLIFFLLTCSISDRQTMVCNGGDVSIVFLSQQIHPTFMHDPPFALLIPILISHERCSSGVQRVVGLVFSLQHISIIIDIKFGNSNVSSTTTQRRNIVSSPFLCMKCACRGYQEYLLSFQWTLHSITSSAGMTEYLLTPPSIHCDQVPTA